MEIVSLDLVSWFYALLWTVIKAVTRWTTLMPFAERSGPSRPRGERGGGGDESRRWRFLPPREYLKIHVLPTHSPAEFNAANTIKPTIIRNMVAYS